MAWVLHSNPGMGAAIIEAQLVVYDSPARRPVWRRNFGDG